MTKAQMAPMAKMLQPGLLPRRYTKLLHEHHKKIPYHDSPRKIQVKADGVFHWRIHGDRKTATKQSRKNGSKHSMMCCRPAGLAGARNCSPGCSIMPEAGV